MAPAALVMLLVVVFTATEAAVADCAGPTFSHTGGDLAHGDAVVVTGHWFGDNCYDTGPPPPGEGSLGRPITDIEVYLEQEGGLHLVAVGDASDDYAWRVDVPVPPVLDVGEARVVVLNNGFEAFNDNPTEIRVTSNRAESASFEPVAFGPAATERPPASPEMGFGGTNWTPLITLIAATAIITASLLLAQRRSTRKER